MSPVLFIRKHVLGLSQAQLAGKLDVTQPTVQRWEKAGLFPAEQQMEVRRLGMEACKTWSDAWFFEVPDTLPERVSRAA